AAAAPSAGAIKAFPPAVAAEVVGMRHRCNRVGEVTVVNREGLLVGIRGALEDLERQLGGRRVASYPHSPAAIDLVVDVALFEIGQKQGRPAPSRPDVVIGGAVGVRVAIDVAGRKAIIAVVVVVQGQADLLEVVGTPHARSGLSYLLHRGYQQAD